MAAPALASFGKSWLFPANESGSWVYALWGSVVPLLVLFLSLNAVYGVFGGVMALLLWIYLSGCGFIFGACLCAAQAEGRSVPAITAIALDEGEIQP